MKTKPSYIPPIAFHPGEELGEKLQDMGMTVNEFAERTLLSPQTILDVIACKIAVDEVIASQFEKVTGIPVHFWLAKQQRYDEFLIQQQSHESKGFQPLRKVAML